MPAPSPYRALQTTGLAGSHDLLHDITGINSKKNPNIGNLAQDVLCAISEEKKINQDIYNCKGIITSNIGQIIETIINERPEL